MFCFKDSNLYYALDNCCKIGTSLNSCTEAGINKSYHIPPTGSCRSAIKLCCSLEQRKQTCDKDFIVTSYDRFCREGPSRAKYETCCTACQIGEEIGVESKFCAASDLPKFRNLTDDSLRDLISECCDRKKRSLMNRRIEKMMSCRDGFYFNGKANQCEDINECEIKNNGCYESQACVNSVGSYSCIPRRTCKLGYRFDHVDLSCKKDYGDVVSVNAENFGFISNRFDDSELSASSNISTHSVCPQGFSVDPKNPSLCVDINECDKNQNHCSHGCRNIKGSFKCLCPKGFKLGPNKKSCEDVNECVEKRKTCGKQICNNLIGSYVCYAPTCPNGYKTYHFTSRNDFR